MFTQVLSSLQRIEETLKVHSGILRAIRMQSQVVVTDEETALDIKMPFETMEELDNAETKLQDQALLKRMVCYICYLFLCKYEQKFLLIINYKINI